MKNRLNRLNERHKRSKNTYRMHLNQVKIDKAKRIQNECQQNQFY